MKIKINHFCFVLWLAGCFPLQAQTDTLFLLKVIQLDSVVISDTVSGFDIGSFIEMVEEDTTFYQAFRNLRQTTYTSTTDARFFDKNGLVEARYNNTARQIMQGRCRHMQVQQASTSGDFFDKHGEMEYFTARLFAYIFLYADTVCTSEAAVGSDHPSADSKMEKRKDQLKTLLFNPGQPVSGIPFVKNELGIFEKKMLGYYDYAIDAVTYQHVPAYKFTIVKKADVKESKVVLQEMETWFNRSDFSIMARNYHLRESNLVYDFDVTMKVVIQNTEALAIPTQIYYAGTWNIPGKKRETGNISISIR
jgi:hypothetical protein